MGPSSASRVGNKMEVVQDTREKHVRKSLGRKHPRTYQVKPKGAMEKPWLLAISTVKALMHTQGFYWERDTGFKVASNILTAQGSWDLLCQVQERRGCHTSP